MCKKYFLSVMVLVILFVCPVVSADDSENEEVSKKDEQTIEKKRFLPWLLDDFKITKNGAKISVTKEKADFYNLSTQNVLCRKENGNIIDDETIFLEPREESFLLSTLFREESETKEKAIFLFSLSYETYEDLCNRDRELKAILDKFPNPVTILENYCLLYSSKEYELMKKNGYSEKRQGECGYGKEYLSEEAYIFPVEEKELDVFLKLVPADKFRAEIYDGFVVLYQIYSGEEAEKRKDFLLHTNGKGNGHWGAAEEYPWKEWRPRPGIYSPCAKIGQYLNRIV